MKRITTIIMIIIFVFSFSISTIATSKLLTDIIDSNYKIEIEKLVEDGTINGYEDGIFKPHNTITRGELTKILSITLNLEEDKEAAVHFTDVKGKWNQGYVGSLFKANIMIGIGPDAFGQDNNVTREELAVILLRIFELEETANELELDVEFDDSELIASWAKNAVALAYKIKLINAIENNDNTHSFMPKGLAERELVAKLIYELKYNKENYDEAILKLKDDVEGLNSSIESTEENQDTKIIENKPSYESIVSKYQNQLSSLESSLSSQLSSLISSAKEELKNGSTLGEVSSKYMGLAYSLEASADSQVSSILSSLSSELRNHGYDSSIVDSLQSQYEAAKDAAIGGF